MEQQASTAVKLAPIIGARKLPITESIDYVDGPVAVQDTSRGLAYQTWRARKIGEDVFLASPNTGEFKIYSMKGIEEISISFDQNARYLLTYLKKGEMYLYWFSFFIQAYETVLLDSGVRTPRLFLDDKRPSQINKDSSDVLLAYIKDGNLYTRLQRDRFLIPDLFKERVEGHLIKVGMGSNLRVQYVLEAFPRTCWTCTLPWGGL